MRYLNTKTISAVTALAVLAVGGVAPVAHAITRGDVQTEVVRFDDLNLTTQAGVQVLYARIRRAARDVCGPAEVIGVRGTTVAWKDCVSTSVNEAVRKVNHPSLSAYYTERLRASAFKATG